MTTMPLRPRAPGRPRRGVSLVEALVALAIMSFGMLALIGVQATLRHNSDAARERTEAMRLAAQDAESLRAFGALDQALVASVTPWDQLAGRANVAVTLPVTTGITTSYTLDRSVNTVYDRVANSTRFEGVQLKLAEVRVSWADRFGNGYAAVLDAAAAAVAPSLSARLVTPVGTAVPSRLGTRHASIPSSAVDLGNGSSALKPFNQGSVVYVLDNATGYVTSQCTGVATAQSALTISDVTGTNCATVLGRLLTGTVRYDLRTTTIDASVSENPQGPNVLPLDPGAPLVFASTPPAVNHAATPAPACYADNPATPALAGSTTSPRSRIDYICIMFPDSAAGWGGQVNLQAGNFPDGSAGNWSLTAPTATHRVCRYTTASSNWTANTDHPKFYCQVTQTGVCDASPQNSANLVRESLRNQNFLVILGTQSCPTDVAADPANGDLVNSNTLPHQP